MKNKFTKLIIALSFTLILCNCGTPAGQTSQESVSTETSTEESTSETFPAESTTEESTSETIPAESATEESASAQETTSQEASSQEVTSQELTSEESMAPEYTIAAMDQIMYAQNAVNLREGPSTDYPKGGSLTKGQEVHVIGQASTGWYQLENELFVSSSYLGDSAPAPEPIPEPVPEAQPLAPTPESAPQESTTPEEPTSQEPTPSQETTQTTTSNQSFIEEVVNLVNAERANEDLGALTLDGTVQAAAMVRVNECVSSFSHTRPGGAAFYTALDEQGASYSTAGENIAYGQTSPQEVVDAWMNSPGHRANIMNGAFTSIGVGYCEDANGTDYWCQIFTG